VSTGQDASVRPAAEVEVKLGAWPGFELPSLDDAVDGLVTEVAEPVTMVATYVDAADLRLIRAGISLRHRTGERGADGAWTLKFPHGSGDGVLRRDEVVVAGPPGRVPAELATLVRPWQRTAELAPVAHLETVRRAIALVVAGERVGEVADDEVSVLQHGRVAARFREVEVECGDDDVRDHVVAVLRDAGAGAPDPTPKLVRALGPRALQPPDLVVVELDRGASAVEVLRGGIAGAVQRIVEHDRVIRADLDPEGIHQARVGCRRLRSDLRTFRSLLDAGWSGPLRDELRWLAGELGPVRDLDVLSARLQRQGAPQWVHARVAKQRGGAQRGAVAALDSRRYLALLDRLVDAAAAPRALPEAEKPAVDVVPALAGQAFGHLRKAVRRLGKRPTDEELHALRIRAKRARYAADVAVPVVGDDARAYTKAVGALQDVLGDLHDCAVAEAWLTDAAAAASRAQAFELGLLVGEQRHEAERLRACWRDAWQDVDRSKRTKWMS
jgi:CHAD domain-containing protein